MVHHINRKDKNCMILLIDVEKAFDKIQHLFLIQAVNTGIEGTFLNIIRAINCKPMANIMMVKS